MSTQEPGARKVGRPTKRTDAIVDEICDRLSDGVPLSIICRDAHMPSRKTVYNWMEADPNISTRIAEARDDGEEILAAQCLEIADTPQIGEVTTAKGNGKVEVRREDMLGHRKLRVWTRMQLLARWNPKKWSGRADGGDQGVTIIDPDRDV